MKRLAALAAFAACSSTPKGFSGGQNDRWTMPLVGPLEDGLLVTSVTIGSHGPYLFAIDPDAPISVVDGELVKESELRAHNGSPRIDETGVPQQRLYVDLPSVEIGTLVIEKRSAIVVKSHTFDAAGRRIHGVLGHDILDESLVFGFDRDQGIATLVEPKVWKPPADAIVLPFKLLEKPMPVVPRRLVKATIGDEEGDFHADLGATTSQLRDTAWDRMKLVSRDVQLGVFDEVGTLRKIDKVSEPTTVTAGGATSKGVVFIPYGDQRFAEHEVIGSLGLGFFAPYNVWLNFQTKSLYLTPRQSRPLATRIGRFDTGALDKCTNPGCATVRLIDPLAGKPLEEGKTHPGVILSVTREEKAGGMPLEVVLEAKLAGKQFPLVIVNLPAHIDRLIDQLPPDFVGATLTVLDASPFPRDCPGRNGCVDKLAR